MNQEIKLKVIGFDSFSMYQFHQENITGNSQVSLALIDRLNNGKPLSLYIDGMFSYVKPDGMSNKAITYFIN